jgi:hypothetical protein
MRIWLKSIRDEHVAFTGKAWLSRAELQRHVRRLGGTPTPGAAVTGNTTVLVRGTRQCGRSGSTGQGEEGSSIDQQQGCIDLSRS